MTNAGWKTRDEARAHVEQLARPLSDKEAREYGINPNTLLDLCSSGHLEKLARGLYMPTSAPPLVHHDLVIVALRVKRATICLVSALDFHDLTTQIPSAVAIALPFGVKEPVQDYPRIETFHFNKATLAEGIETHELDAVPVQITSPEKTIADCFKFRNKIGMDIALEAIHLYKERRTPPKLQELMKYARICRVQNVMRPYLEALFT